MDRGSTATASRSPAPGYVYLEGAFCDLWLAEILRGEWRDAEDSA